jgi:hypothetical protein
VAISWKSNPPGSLVAIITSLQKLPVVLTQVTLPAALGAGGALWAGTNQIIKVPRQGELFQSSSAKT